MMGGFGLFGWGMGLMVLFWGGLFVGAIWLVASLLRGNSGTFAASPTSVSRQQTPLDILNERYARGEINREQYEEIMHNLVS